MRAAPHPVIRQGALATTKWPLSKSFEYVLSICRSSIFKCFGGHLGIYSKFFDAVPFTVRMLRCEDFYSRTQLRPRGHNRIWRDGEDGWEGRDDGALPTL